MSEWIEWKGGTRPVNRHELVDVKFADGEISERETADFWCWNIDVEKALADDDTGGGIIISYRLSSPAKQAEEQTR